MKLWHISQQKNNDYDTYSDAVVAADTESEAAMIHPGGDGNIELFPEEGFEDRAWTNDVYDVSVEYIGEAKIGTKKGVICASFHAG